MPATVAADFTFTPKVWKDHVRAYFDEKLVFGAIAVPDTTLKAEPGETINFPYFVKTGDATDLDESVAIPVDSITDNSFQATVKEVGKALGVKAKAFKKSAAKTSRISSNSS